MTVDDKVRHTESAAYVASDAVEVHERGVAGHDLEAGEAWKARDTSTDPNAEDKRRSRGGGVSQHLVRRLGYT